MNQTEQHIIQVIKNGGRASERQIEFIYARQRKPIFHYIKQNRGSRAEAEDILQDAVVAFYSSILKDKFKAESGIDTYIFSIAKFMWLNRLKRKSVESKYMESQDHDAHFSAVLPQYLDGERRGLIDQVLEQLKSGCKDILLMFYFQKYSMKEIAVLLPYENEQVARNKKYKCLKHLKELVGSDKKFKQILRDS